MKLFKKRSQKSGYCNISEPISDLDPKRISAIKLKQVGELDPKVISAIKAQHTGSGKVPPPKDDTDDATITLTPSPSQSSKSAARIFKGSSGSSSESHSAETPAGNTASETITTCTPPDTDSSIKKQLFISPNGKKATKSMGAFLPFQQSPEKNDSRSSANFDNEFSPKPPIAPKTPDTFFQGRNRKRITKHTDEIATEAPTDHLNVFALADQGPDNDNTSDEIDNESKQSKQYPKDTIQVDVKHQLPINETQPLEKCESASSDLNKTFSPEIISVSSDITDPTFHNTRAPSRKNSRRPWRKWKKIREGFAETCRQHDLEAPLSVLDLIVDSLCSGQSSN